MRILIADDDATTRTLMKSTVSRWDYEVETAVDGARALAELTADDPPRLALLDWMMPGHDGISVCRAVKERKDAPYVYIILLTSRGETEDIVEGLDAGADDFLVKPVDPNELRSRMNVGVRILEYEHVLAEKNRQLERYATQMERLAEERARQLVHADRLAMLGTLSAGIAHEINNPAGYITGNVQLVEKFWPDLQAGVEALRASGGGDPKRQAFILEEAPRCLAAIRGGIDRIANIVKSLKSFSRRDEDSRESTDINDCVRNALEIAANAVKHRLAIELDLDESLPRVPANAQQIEQVLVNLVINAGDAVAEEERGNLSIATSRDETHIYITVEDDGPGIPADLLPRIWEPFFTTKNKEGTGLGLSISRGIMESHGGAIRAENGEAGGARFLLTLPIPQGSPQV